MGRNHFNKKLEPKQVNLSESEIDELKKKIQEGKLSSADQELLVNILQGFVWLNKMLRVKQLSMIKLKRLFGFQSEKRPKENDESKHDDDPPPSPSGGGHGKNGAEKHSGAKRVFHEHETLRPADRCPECHVGTLYDVDPGSFIHVEGRSPLISTIHLTQKLRCNACGRIFTAKLPKEVNKKYDESADVAIAILKYGTGTPFYRLDGLQKTLGVPFPRSTLWERVEQLGTSTYPIYERLIQEAAKGEVSYVDDTTGKILDLKKRLREEKSERMGIYTSGIVSRVKEKTIKLFFTGNRHAGENLDRVLKNRPSDYGPLIQMSDALAQNRVKEGTTISALCLAHARRNFIDVENDRPKECAFVIRLFGQIYGNDKIARERKLTPVDRLAYHQKRSGPVVRRLRRWCLKSFYLRKIEPNEPCGEAIQYLLNHWEGLTQFLRVPGAPLDNNEAERLLKKSILHRKNSLFYKTELGAYVGDVIMSLIQTCSSAGKNPFDYLTALHRNKKSVHADPSAWLPWNFEQNLALSL